MVSSTIFSHRRRKAPDTTARHPAPAVSGTMRLLNVDTFQFAEFFYQTPPPYAILSHTWGDDSEEVSYSNVLAGRLDSPDTRPAKVSGCCDQARKDGYEYVWIDTCCIDKTNSVELHEAINSMFKWYRDAAICYVYLADVPPGDEIHNPNSRFHMSRWFERGWTLQELLAPLHLRFYDADWQFLSTKGELCEVIEGITGIPSPYLLGIHELHHASIAQRMSWAASRVTKREEDIAYCLLGIFDIVMLMIYGEGHNAFRRLQEEIIRKHTSDDSILAWGLYPNTPPRLSSALAIHPSQFALSGQIVSRPGPGTDSLDVHTGPIRLNLRILPQPGPDEMLGALRCGPEHDPQMSVCLPLTRPSGDEDGDYSRISERCAVLKRIVDSHRALPCRIRVDGKPRQSTASAQMHFFHIQRSPSARNLEIVDVQPPERWHKERSLIEAPAPNGDGQHRAFLRLRDGNRESSDFVIVLEAVASGPALRAQCDVMTASKDTPLSEIQGMIDAMRLRLHQALRQSANNGALTLRAVLKSEATQRTFSLRLEKLSDAPAQTTNATLELENIRRNMEMECLRKADEAVVDEIEALEHKKKAERMSLEEVDMTLLRVEEELQMLLNRKSRLDNDKAGHVLRLDAIREEIGEKRLKMHTLDSWLGAAGEEMKSFVNGDGTRVVAGSQTLHLAAEKGYEDLVKALLEKGASIEDTAKRGWTPLHAAAWSGHTGTVQLLLDKGANMEIKADDDWTPLHSAVQKGHESVVRLLLERGAKMTPTFLNGWIPLLTATLYGFESIVRLLLDHGADVAARSNKDSASLHIAAQFGHLAVAELLLARGADVMTRAKESLTPLHLAASFGHQDIVSLLLDKGASHLATLVGSNSTALHMASHRGRENVVRLLLERGASPTAVETDGSTPLHSAAVEGSVGIMRLLIEHGAEVEAQSKDGSVLALAAYYGHEDAVRFLIRKGADITDRLALVFAHRGALRFPNRPGFDAIARILHGDRADAPKRPRLEVAKEMPAGGAMAMTSPRKRHILIGEPSPADHMARTRTSSLNVTGASSYVKHSQSLSTDSYAGKGHAGAEEEIGDSEENLEQSADIEKGAEFIERAKGAGRERANREDAGKGGTKDYSADIAKATDFILRSRRPPRAGANGEDARKGGIEKPYADIMKAVEFIERSRGPARDMQRGNREDTRKLQTEGRQSWWRKEKT